MKIAPDSFVKMHFKFRLKDGSKLPGLITEINDQDVTVDFNHPLSGQIIVFEAKILDVVDKEGI